MKAVAGILGILAVALLGEDRDESRIRGLAADLSDKRAEVREEASRRLAELGEAAEPVLLEAARSADPEARVRAEDLLAGIRLGREQAPSCWVALTGEDRSAVQAFADLGAQAGRPVNAAEVVLDGRRCRGAAGRFPFWQALDLLSMQAGCAYRYQFDRAIDLVDAPPPSWPTCYVGPFRVVLTTVNVETERDFLEGKTRRRASLRVELQWERHARPVALASRPRIDAARDDSGKPILLAGERGPRSFFGLAADPPNESRPRYQTIHIVLESLGEGARRLQVVRGSVDVLFHRGPVELTWDHPSEQMGETRSLGGAEATLVDFSIQEGKARVRYKLRYLAPLGKAEEIPDLGTWRPSPRISLLTEAGQKLKPLRGEGGQKDGGWTWEQWFEGMEADPSAVSLEVFTRVVPYSVPFEFTDVDLP